MYPAGYSIDEKPDDPVHIVQSRRTPRNNGAEYGLFGIVIPAEQDTPDSPGKRVQGDRLAGGEILYLCQQVAGNEYVLVGKFFFPRFVGKTGNRRWRFKTLQITGPELLQRLFIEVFQPFDIRPVGRRGGPAYGQAFCQEPVGVEKIIDHDAQAPAVQDNVMKDPDQLEAFLIGL